MFRIAAFVLSAVCAVNLAYADLFIPLSNNDYLILPDGFVLLLTVVVGALVGLMALARAVDGRTIYTVAERKSAEDYDQEAAEYRAKARMLDAEAAYDDSRAKAALKKQELKDVEEFLRSLPSKATRR